MKRRAVLVLMLVVMCLAAVASPAAAGPTATPEALLLSDGVLDRIGLTPGDGVERPLPARPECAAIARTTALSEGAITAVASRRSADRRGDVVLDETVRVFETPGAARAFVQPYRDEDPAEECVEAVIAELVSERGVVLDTFADDRTVPLGGAPGIAYLAEAEYADGDRELKVRAEQIVARLGDAVVDVLVLAPEDSFVEVATRVERDLAARLRAARQ